MHLIFLLFYYVVTSLFYPLYIHTATTSSWNEFIKNTLLGNNFYHLYFIAIIIQMYILAPALALAVKKSGKFTLLVSFILNFATLNFVGFPYIDRFFDS